MSSKRSSEKGEFSLREIFVEPAAMTAGLRVR